MKHLISSLSAVFLLISPLAAQGIDDADIGGRAPAASISLRRLRQEGRQEGFILVFPTRLRPSSAGLTPAENAVTGSLQLADRHGLLRPAKLARARLLGPDAPDSWVETDAAGRFVLKANGGQPGPYRVRFSLDNKFWAFQNPESRASYEWETPPFDLGPQGVDLGSVSPTPGSENANAGLIHLTYLDGLRLLQREADVAWWENPLTIHWPGSADFFSPWAWSLDLTNPAAWDVILHELGHAVMSGAMDAEMAGGQHKIDECYSPELAWSEGWATFFAAAARLSRDDADAKFEFLVPRRAPIRIEHVPEDVCRGASNEWRVSAGLWDLIDTHDDGLDHFTLPFSQLWRSLRGQKTNGLLSAWALIAAPLNPDQRRAAEQALIQNTLLPARPHIPSALAAELFSAPRD